MNIAIILAGGIGSRVGADRPKQFIEVFNKPILYYTIKIFQNHPEIDAIEVVCHKLWKDYLNEMIRNEGFNKVKWVVDGGNTFQESVLNGVFYLENKISLNDIVQVHFGASPFIENDIISDNIRVCKDKGNAISATDFYLLSAIKDINKSVENKENFTHQYIDRDTIACMSSPHAFRYGLISSFYKKAIKSGIIDEVEPHTTTLMQKMNIPIYFSKGSQTNIKITKKEDIELFKGFLMVKDKSIFEQKSGDVVIYLADGFEEYEGLLVAYLLKKAGISTITASTTGRISVISSQGLTVATDVLAEDVDYDKVKLLILPGGINGTKNLYSNKIVREKCIEFVKDKKIAALSSAPIILKNLGLLKNKKVACCPSIVSKMKDAIVIDDKVVVDYNIITSKGLEATIPFVLKIISIMKNPEIALRVKEHFNF